MTPERWRQVTEIFHAAVARDASSRASYLDQACGRDRELRLEVDAMVAAHTAGARFGETPVHASTVASPRLAIGTTIRSFRIDALIGTGGMGEVYRARDVTLGRDVAIKVLPAAFTSDAGRLARFEREARLLAALNHPHIAAIHSLEAHEGAHALVLELVEGPTLAERLARGPLPVKEALEVARQIAEALEAAHDHGIIHRDLKPANIKVTPDGVVKVLDFGLAKAFAGASADLSQLPTLSADRTHEGTIAGTPAYMSPEQARGQAVDKRTDIWAFGCVLYELLTGRTAFAAPTISDTIVAVLERDPDWGALPEKAPPSIRRVLRRCLEKDPNRRLRDIGDARLEIDEAMNVPTSLAPSQDRRRVHAGPWWVAAGGLVVGIALASLTLAIWLQGQLTGRPPSAPLMRSTTELPSDAPIALGGHIPQIGYDSPLVAISPDGRRLAYVGQTSSGTMLYLRDLAGVNLTPVAGTEGAIHPFFSPDGRWLGFLTNDKVKKVPLDGGTVITLCDAQVPVQATWTADDTIYFDEGLGFRWSRVSAQGGTPVPVRMPAPRVFFSQALPGGAILATAQNRGLNRDYADVVLVSASGEMKVVLRGGYSPRYVAPGYLIFARGGNLWTVAFDPATGQTTGEPVTVAAGVSMDSTFRLVHAAASNNGVIAYVPGGNRAIGYLAWVDRQGQIEQLPVPPRVYGMFDVSRQGDRVAVHVGDVTDYVWIYDFNRREGRRLPAGENSGWPIWNPDGRMVTHAAWRSPDAVSVIAQSPDGSGAVRQIVAPVAENIITESWTPDGQSLALTLVGPGLRRAIATAEGRLDRIATNNVEQYGNDFSPDGRWLAFNSSETGQFEVYVESFPDRKTVRQISTDGGLEPRWCRCGELFYRNGNRWMSIKIRTEPDLQWDPPRLAFQTDFLDSPGRSYDVSPDGMRLLVVKRAEPDIRNRINLVVNWTSLLDE